MLNKVGFKRVLPAILVSFLSFMAFVSLAVATDATVPPAMNLQEDGIVAQEKGIPVLLEFSMHGCSFCEQVEDEVLKPMLISGDYDDKVIIRKIMIDEDTSITDFNGKPVAYEDLASRYRIFVTPTLVLLHGNGEVMGLEMVGVTTIDFYGAYLDQAIDMALHKISTVTKPDKLSAGSPTS